MVTSAHDAVTVAAAISYDLHWKIVEGDIQTNLFQRTEDREGRDAIA